MALPYHSALSFGRYHLARDRRTRRVLEKGPRLRVSSDEHHVALPKLYGAPAYARPPRPTEVLDRPVDPDDLPLELERTPEEHELASRIAGSTFAPAVLAPANGNGHGRRAPLVGRPFRLRGLTGRLFRNS
jgi:hypothetical protein